jgi:hypothetical protein
MTEFSFMLYCQLEDELQIKRLAGLCLVRACLFYVGGVQSLWKSDSDGGFEDILRIFKGCFWVNSKRETPIGFAVGLRDKDLQVLGIDTVSR